MEELLKTNDPVLISFLEVLLKESDIDYMLLDQNMSIMEGSIGVIPRRILVERDRLNQARRLVIDSDLAHELPELNA